MRLFRALMTGCAAAVAVAACTATRNEPIPRAGDIAWADQRWLTWNDFLGPVDPRAGSERVAMTAASLSWGYEYQIERGEDDCAYRITAVRAQAIFNQRDSWVRPGHRNPTVLAHEQGHFDLTQIYKVILDERASELIGRRNACEGDSLEAASSFTEKDAAALVQALFDEVWQAYLAAQATYDQLTRNGTEPQAQEEWTGRIERALRDGRWAVPAAEQG